MEQTAQKKSCMWLTRVWQVLTVLTAAALCTLSVLPAREALITRANGLMRTAFDLVLGNLSALLSDAFIAWFVIALGFMLLTWFAWLAAEHGDRARRYKAMLPALYIGVVIAAICTLLPVIIGGAAMDLTFCGYAASGVLLMLAAIFVYGFCWDRFPKLVNAETVSYVVFGVLTTIVNLVTYNFCADWLHFSTAWSTSLAWLAGVIFAYVVNKLFVFHSNTESFGALCKEAFLFFFARFLTYFIDLGGMLLLVDVMHVGGGLSKILCNILVLILNYVFSKLFIFKNSSNKAPSDDTAK